MQNELRPCRYVTITRGTERMGLFHCWAVSNGNTLYSISKGETVALVEVANGKVLEIKSQNVCFLDTVKQQEKYQEYFEVDKDDSNSTEQSRTKPQS